MALFFVLKKTDRSEIGHFDQFRNILGK